MFHVEGNRYVQLLTTQSIIRVLRATHETREEKKRRITSIDTPWANLCLHFLPH